MKLRLNRANVNSLEPADKDYLVKDAGCPGLVVIVRPTGTRTFSVLVRRGGKYIKRSLGRFPELSVTAARERAADVIAEAASAKEQRTVTFGELFRERLNKVEKRTKGEDVRKFDRHLAHWESRRVDTIKPADVRELVDDVGEKIGKSTRNRVLSLVKSVLAYGCIDQKYLKYNVADTIKKSPEVPRKRFLTAAELPKFFESVEQEPRDYRDVFLLLLYTGARRANVCEMRWSELDLGNMIWTIPGDKSKNGTDLFLPITEPALAILDWRYDQFSAVSPWVFPNPRNKTGHLQELRKPWLRVCKRAGLENMRIHDLRHTVASWAAISGASLPQIGQMLGHRDPKSTARYAHLSLDPVRQVSNTASAAMQAAGKGGVR